MQIDQDRPFEARVLGREDSHSLTVARTGRGKGLGCEMRPVQNPLLSCVHPGMSELKMLVLFQAVLHQSPESLLRNWPVNLPLLLVLSGVVSPRAPGLSLSHCAVGLVVTLK